MRKGADVCILTYGVIIELADKVARGLEAQGLNPALVSCHTLKPFDEEGVAKILEDYDKVIVIEEHVAQGGLGARVKQLAWDSQAQCQLQTFSLQDEFIHNYGSRDELLSAHGLDEGRIAAAVGRTL